jgi:hypothetical protein
MLAILSRGSAMVLIRGMGRPVVRSALVVLLLAGGGVAAGEEPPAHLGGFQALLFNSKTGAFSADVLADNRPLGNVPIGESASVSTFVIVDVHLVKDAPVPRNLRVRLVAIDSGAMPFSPKQPSARSRVILDQTSTVGPVNPDGVTHVGFWLAATGCRTILLKASLLGVRGATPISTVLPFACYE